MQRAFSAVPRSRWRDHQVAILKKLAGAGWTPADYKRLHCLTVDLRASGTLLRARAITPALIRSMWQTPDWMWGRELGPVLAKQHASRSLASRANRDFLFGLAPRARPIAVRLLKEAKSGEGLRTCLAKLRRSGLVARSFPKSPVTATDVLRPLDSFAALQRERFATGVAFETFYDAIFDGACYFFAWLGRPRATILVVFDESIKHIECRKAGNIELVPDESAPLVSHVVACFESAGLRLPASRTKH